MTHLQAILWLLSWPTLIFISYQLSKYLLKWKNII